MARKRQTTKKVEKRRREPDAPTAVPPSQVDPGSTSVTPAQFLEHQHNVTQNLEKFAASLDVMSNKIDQLCTKISEHKPASRERSIQPHEPRPKKRQLAIGDRVECKRGDRGVVTGILSGINHAWLSVNVDGKQQNFRRQNVSLISLAATHEQTAVPSDEAHEDPALLDEEGEIP